MAAAHRDSLYKDFAGWPSSAPSRDETSFACGLASLFLGDAQAEPRVPARAAGASDAQRYTPAPEAECRGRDGAAAERLNDVRSMMVSVAMIVGSWATLEIGLRWASGSFWVW